MSHDQDEIIRQEIMTMLSGGIIEPGSGPWGFPVVLVKKKDGKIRFCVDFRRLNAVTVADVYPIPRIDEALDQMGAARWFTVCDLASGYWQVEMAPDGPNVARSAMACVSSVFG